MLRATYDKPENDFVLNWGRQCSRRRLLSGVCHMILISLLFKLEMPKANYGDSAVQLYRELKPVL